MGGIGNYGNSTGVATVGGEAVFDEAYADNCLVNAMSVGLLRADRVTGAKATAPGAFVVLYGATTGRDGIGGASVLASQELGEERRQLEQFCPERVGDPNDGRVGRRSRSSSGAREHDASPMPSRPVVAP